MGSMKTMDRTGHTTLEYEVEDKQAVASAQQTFELKIKEGYAPFVKLEDGSHVQVQRDRFDARENYLMVPAVVGG